MGAIGHAFKKIEHGIEHVAHKIEHGVEDAVKGVAHQVEHLGKDVIDVGKDALDSAEHLLHGAGDLLTGDFKGALGQVEDSGKAALRGAGSLIDSATSAVADVADDSLAGAALNHTALGQDVERMKAAIGKGVLAVGEDVVKYATPIGLADEAAEHGLFGSAGEKIASFGNNIAESAVGDPLKEALTSTNVGKAADGFADLATLAVPGAGEAEVAAKGAVAVGGSLAKGSTDAAADAVKDDSAGAAAADGDIPITTATVDGDAPLSIGVPTNGEPSVVIQNPDFISDGGSADTFHFARA